MKEITSIYPTLNPENLYFPKCLEYFKVVRNISQYDHFLDEQEANKMIFFNATMDKNERSSFHLLEERYIRSFFELLKRFDLYTYEYFYSELSQYSQDRIELMQIKVNDELELKVKNGLRELKEFRFLIPELSSIILSDYDSEVIIYANTIKSAEAIFSCFEKEGFFLLGS